MTPQLEAAIAAIQLLSSAERQQLLQLLNQSQLTVNLQVPANLKLLNTQFWQGVTLQYLLMTQTPKTVENLKALAVEFWPQEESADEFLTFLRQQRQAMI